MSAEFLADPKRRRQGAPRERVVSHSRVVKFGPQLVRVQREARDWRQAVTYAGQPLVDAGCARPGFTDRLISVIETYGPYMVIAPGLALVHAHPGLDSLENGLSAATFPRGVNFGHSHFDAVGLVLGLTAASPAEHLAIIAEVAAAVERQKNLVADAVDAKTPAELTDLLRSCLANVPLA